jgi:hypothetical protein
MKKLIVALLLALCAPAGATPSEQILIPSTDIQPYKVLHLNFDTFIRTQNENDGRRLGPMVLVGPTVGVLPWEKVRAEASFDLLYKGVKELDDNPLYFHGKVATPERSLEDWPRGLCPWWADSPSAGTGATARPCATSRIAWPTTGCWRPGTGPWRSSRRSSGARWTTRAART